MDICVWSQFYVNRNKNILKRFHINILGVPLKNKNKDKTGNLSIPTENIRGGKTEAKKQLVNTEQRWLMYSKKVLAKWETEFIAKCMKIRM